MKSRGWFKCTNRRYFRLWSIAPLAVYHAARTILAGCDSEALLSRALSHRRRRARVLQPGSAGNTKRYCNAGTDSPDGSWMRPRPRHFASMFQLAPPSTSQKHCWHLQSHRGFRNLQKLVRSTLGLTDVSNLLPARVVEQKSVVAMQHELQCLLKFRAVNREDGWQHTFSPRVSSV